LGAFDEDCLYLNIWSAAKSANDWSPVMVWFPGGGFTTGGGSALVFDGESLARKGVVVVTTNYRLGALGFFAHPDLTQEANGEPTGNFGLMDQTAALRWVQKNIAMFGGDRNRVTIFGQSAGATSVLYQTALPGTKGLFQRAIGESSGGTGGILALDRILTTTEAEATGLNTARALGVTSLNDLRVVSATRLVTVHQAHGPFIDGRLVVEAPDVVLAAGRHNDVPLLVGSNVENGNTRQPFFDTYSKTYPSTSPEEANGEAMAWRVRRWADLQTKSGRSKAYLYYFTRDAPADGPVPSAAYHGAELPYVFHNLHLFDHRWSPVDRQLEEVVSSYWVNFARSGDPNGSGLPRWPAYERSNGTRVMVLDDRVGPGRSRLDDAKIALFDTYRQTLTSK
jgi:para-nitrobenzyl esterase